MITHWFHLVRRFLGSLWPFGPSATRDDWARAHLLDGETELWSKMSRADRRHAIGVARQAEVELGDAATRPVLAAALLHDVGKVDSGYGPWRRSIATVLGMLAGHERARGWDGRAGRYLRHDQIGAKLLADAGSDDLTVTWAREHHLAPARWSIPREIGDALKSADDD